MRAFLPGLNAFRSPVTHKIVWHEDIVLQGIVNEMCLISSLWLVSLMARSCLRTCLIRHRSCWRR